MALTCNIDAKGKVARLIYGLLVTLCGALMMAFWAWPSGLWQPWAIAGVVVVFGMFGVFEAWAGWCVMRAMGFKTRI